MPSKIAERDELMLRCIVYCRFHVAFSLAQEQWIEIVLEWVSSSCINHHQLQSKVLGAVVLKHIYRPPSSSLEQGLAWTQPQPTQVETEEHAGAQSPLAQVEDLIWIWHFSFSALGVERSWHGL